MGKTPSAVVLLTEKVNAELPEPGLAMELFEKLRFVPVGAPVALRATSLLKFRKPAVVTIVLPFPFRAIRMEAGAVANAKSGATCASIELTARAITQIIAATAILQANEEEFVQRRFTSVTNRVVICRN
jgi:hypothetical protein